MKYLLLLCFFVSLLARPLFGEITENQIQGDWGFGFSDKDFTRASISSFLPGGVYSEEGTINVRFDGELQKFPFRIRGTWRFENGTVVISVKQSTAPDFIKAGTIEKYQVFKITNITMLYSADPDRKIYEAQRTHKP